MDMALGVDMAWHGREIYICMDNWITGWMDGWTIYPNTQYTTRYDTIRSMYMTYVVIYVRA